MKNLWKDERADSMVIFVIVCGTLMFGFLYLLLTQSINLPIHALNEMIDSGLISVDTNTHLKTMVEMWQASPFFFIIGLILFCFERMKGESVTSDAFFGYLVLMVITLQISAYLVWAFGTSMDAMIGTFETLPEVMNYSPEWDVSDTRNVCLAGMYYGAMMPGFIGSVLYMLHPILKQRENSFLDDGQQTENSDGEYITNYSLEQM